MGFAPAVPAARDGGATSVNKKYVLLPKIFLQTMLLSAFTFGGGYVIVPLMQKRFVEKLHWIEHNEMLDFVAIAQSAPGPIAINTSVLVGHRLAGLPGSLSAVLGTVFPPLVILGVLAGVYASFSGNPWVAAAMFGMRAGVAAVILDVAVSLVKNIIKEKSIFSAAVLVLAFAAKFIFGVNILLILAASAAACLVFSLTREKKKKGGGEA